MAGLPKLRVLHYLYSLNARNRVVAHCLNFDLVTAADTFDEAVRRLDTVVRFHIESYLQTGGMSCLNEPAPSHFWAEYTEALRQGHTLPASTLRINVPDTVPMQMPYGEVEVVAARVQ